MALRLTLCSICTPTRPDVQRLVEQLKREYSHELVVNEVECMAACDDTPAVMVEYDYYPKVTATRLRQLIEARLGRRQA